MILPAVTASLLAAAPAFVTSWTLEPQAAVDAAAQEGWHRLEATYQLATGASPTAAEGPIELRRSSGLARGRSGESQLGVVLLRQDQPWTFGETEATALRHELAHQFLWVQCPAAADDHLFHEAFAVATSGELPSWSEGPYVSLPKAVAALEEPGVDLDSRPARRALARLLSERAETRLPTALSRRLSECAAGARWTALTPEALANTVSAAKDAFVVLNRHTGEVLVSEGAATLAMPFGSTLKPFIAAAHGDGAPRLPPRSGSAEWECGAGLGPRVDLSTAVLRSCNGYFLDWAKDPSLGPPLGNLGPVLIRAGLSGLPRDMPEAIGLKSSLQIPPRGLAEAYRALAELHPEMLAVLDQNAERGTLSGLSTSRRLWGVSLKTGTVRDEHDGAIVGWIVAVDADRVGVMARAGAAPRAFVSAFADAWERVRTIPGQSEAAVQVFGLIPPEQVEARCAADGPAFLPLRALTAGGRAVCIGGEWRVRFPGADSEGRPYAGTFEISPPPVPATEDPRATPHERRARRGSEFVFRTSLARYVAGVVLAEDARIVGPARTALERVVAHNALHAETRHGGRPPCDTTHCQTFLGTHPAGRDDLKALASAPLPYPGWLPYSRGGDEPWTERRTATQLRGVAGADVVRIQIEDGRVAWVLAAAENEAAYETLQRVSCERVRGPLHLPSCPNEVTQDPSGFLFRGRGRGHGLGLDVEAAKRAEGDADEILDRAYGASAARGSQR